VLLVHTLENEIKNEDYLIRCACFHSIAQFCEDKIYTFQQRFSSKIIEWCLLGLEDPVGDFQIDGPNFARLLESELMLVHA